MYSKIKLNLQQLFIKYPKLQSKYDFLLNKYKLILNENNYLDENVKEIENVDESDNIKKNIDKNIKEQSIINNVKENIKFEIINKNNNSIMNSKYLIIKPTHGFANRIRFLIKYYFLKTK